MIAARLAALGAVLLASGAGAAPPPVALTATPPSMTLAAAARQTIRVVNSGARRAVVDVRPAAFALTPRGRPRVLVDRASFRHAAAWLLVTPQLVALAPGQTADVTVVAHPPPGASPGDHAAVVLLTTRAVRSATVAVRMRIGIGVVVRVHGRVRHRLRVRRVHVVHAQRGVVVRVTIANTGNVVEWIRRNRLSVSLVQRGRAIARLTSGRRELLPGSVAWVDLRYPGRGRGRAIAHVALTAGATIRQSFVIRL